MTGQRRADRLSRGFPPASTSSLEVAGGLGPEAIIVAACVVGFFGCLQSPIAPFLVHQEASFTLAPAPGPLHEIQVYAPLGEQLKYDWLTYPPSQLDFDVHEHSDSGIWYAERGNYSKKQGQVAGAGDSPLSFSWRNRHPEPVEVLWRIDGDARVEAGSGSKT